MNGRWGVIHSVVCVIRAEQWNQSGQNTAEYVTVVSLHSITIVLIFTIVLATKTGNANMWYFLNMTVIDINQMYSFRLYGNYNYCKKKAFEKILSMFFFFIFFSELVDLFTDKYRICFFIM